MERKAITNITKNRMVKFGIKKPDLSDINYITDLFNKNLPKHIKLDEKSISLKVIKKSFKKGTLSAVIKYEINQSKQKFLIFCSANSSKINKKTFKTLEFANKHGLTEQKPLFYDSNTGGLFYLGIKGENLLEIIQKKDSLEKYIKQTSEKLVKLHSLPIRKTRFPKFSSNKKRIMDPYKVLEEKKKHKSLRQKKIKNLLKKIETAFKKENYDQNLSICHGDFHPKNVIMGKTGTSLIDFDYTCLANPALDLGEFIEQIDLMAESSLPASKREKIKKLFIDTYKDKNKAHILNLENLILVFQAWFCLRTAVYFIDDSYYNETAADSLIEKTNEYLKKVKR